MQMSRTALAVNELKKKNIPFVVVLTDPTTGGVTASWAMLGDILIAEPKQLLVLLEDVLFKILYEKLYQMNFKQQNM